MHDPRADAAWTRRHLLQSRSCIAIARRLVHLVLAWRHHIRSANSKMDLQDLKRRFFKREQRTVLFLKYVLMSQQIIPHFASKLSKDDLRALSPLIGEVIDLSRQIYDRPDLGSKPPDPIPFDPNPPAHELSDQVRDRIGRYNPSWDFANAPFTHPLGTELAMWCIDSQWNAYDTFVKALVSKIKTNFDWHPRVVALRSRESSLALSDPRATVPTEEQLEILKISATWDEIRTIISQDHGFSVSAEHAEDSFVAAKKLRGVRTHEFGEPSSWLASFMNTHPFCDFQIRLLDGEMEVTTLFSRNAMEAIKAKVIVLADKANRTY